MATTSIPHRWKYDVFVSFRGEDIRKSFMDHMFNDFKEKGIHAFRDDRELPKGEEISPHLYKAIEESRFLIVIFSKNYASSTWCLRELVKILECKQIEDPKHEVRIIFYDAKPDVVRKQKRSYAKAFAKHDVSNRTEVDKWREALSMAANLSGWDLQDMTNGYEYKFINSISREILKKLCDGPLHVGENLVGIDFHFNKLNFSHFVGSDKVNMIGICGISGIGKTTLAKAVYNSMHTHFDGSCFCDNVQGVEKQQGLTQLQMQMIGKILKTDDLKISSVGEGSMVIKQRMACKRILLVLDDVNNVEQLEALAGSRDWFYPVSLIIFTGKNKQLLRSHKVDIIYEMESLGYYEALELFSLYAFDKRHPTKDSKELASQVIIHLQGHPLALKMFGGLLREKPVDVWEGELKRLQTYPNSEIVQKLRPSFDSLASDQKRMFLDIACAFIGENKAFAASVLDGSHCSANAIIEVLADKFLITVSAYNMRLQMHELIQSMAREIVREEFIMAGKQRRLCISSAIYNASSEKNVAMTEAIEVLVLLLRESSQKVHINANSFANMKILRILKIYAEKEFEQKHELKGHNVIFSGNLYCLSNELSLFYWHGCPFKYLPSEFYPQNIVAIDLSYSHIKQLWTTPKSFRRLKAMKLRYCCNLKTTPDFLEITNLEELSLEGCVNLVSVHPSIGMLKRLVVLNLRDCKRLQNFPSKVEMDALQVLNLTRCLKVDQLPEALGRIKSLRELHVDRTAITELPSFVSYLINLESLSFGGQERIQPKWWTSITGLFGLLGKQQHPQRSIPSLAGLHMLTDLNLSYCNLLEVPESIGGLSCLQKLNLKGNNLLEVPESIGGLSCLQKLNLKGNNLLEVPESIGGLSCLQKLNLKGNNLLEVPESIGGLSCLQKLNLKGNNLLEVPESIGGLSCLQKLNLKGNNLLEVPESIGGLSCLQKLNLKGNNLLEVPESIGGLSCLQKLNLKGNNLLEVPESIGGLSCLQKLNLKGNNLLEVPESIGGLSCLQKLNLKGNNLLEVPESIGGLSCLQKLNLKGNNLLEVPESIGGLSCLQKLNLKGNNLLEVPESIGGLSCLQKLNLKGNNLLEVPESIGGLSCLQKLNLKGNNLLEVPESIGGLSCLQKLNLKGNNLLEVPESIGGLSCLDKLNLEGNNFTSLPGSFSQLSHLQVLNVGGCKKLEVLPELPPYLFRINASDCTSLREVLVSSKRQFRNRITCFTNCPMLFKNVTIDNEGSISKSQCLDSSITSQVFIHQLSAFLGYAGFQTTRCEFFLQDTLYSYLDILYHGKSIPKWFTNKSTENHVKVELPSDWCSRKFKGYGTCVVFKCKKPCNFKGYSVKNFDGVSLTPKDHIVVNIKPEVTGIQDMIWLHYTRDTCKWNKAKNFVTFCIEENNEDIEVKECGSVRLICYKDIEQEVDVNMLHGLPTPTQHGGILHLFEAHVHLHCWTC